MSPPRRGISSGRSFSLLKPSRTQLYMRSAHSDLTLGLVLRDAVAPLDAANELVCWPLMTVRSSSVSFPHSFTCPWFAPVACDAIQSWLSHSQRGFAARQRHLDRAVAASSAQNRRENDREDTHGEQSAPPVSGRRGFGRNGAASSLVRTEDGLEAKLGSRLLLRQSRS